MSDYRNPLSVNIPFEFRSANDYPNEAVAARFQAYRDILKSLITYLDQYASVQEEIVRQQSRLQQAVDSSTHVLPEEKYGSHKGRDRSHDEESLSALNQIFLPIGNGSIQDIPTIFTKFHQQNVQNGRRTLKEIRLVIIPKLDELRKELMNKIREIKTLHNDFDGKLPRELSHTGQMLDIYSHSLDYANRLDIKSKSHDSDADTFKKDPFLAKQKLQTQLKVQLREEDYLYKAYVNLQTASEKLESIVVEEIQRNLGHFLSLIEAEKSSVSDFLVPTLSEGFLAKEPNFEWQSFVERNLPKSSTISNRNISGKFIDLTFPSRKFADLSIPHFNSLLSVPVRQGYLEKKTKFLKSNVRTYFVLTCSYLHEYKTSDLKKDPLSSISLDTSRVSQHSKDPGGCKFDLTTKASGIMIRNHHTVFKCDTPQTMKEWYNDLKTLMSLSTPTERAKHMSKVLQANTALEKKESRASSMLSTQTNALSLRSAVSSAKPANISSKKRSSVISKNESIGSSTPNHRLSSTFSNHNQQSQLVSNYNERDETVTSTDERPILTDHMVDENGDILIKAQRPPEANGFTLNTGPAKYPQPVPQLVQYPNSANYAMGNPQPMIPQNIQYHASPQPQQFYDPVLQQYFTINAIPALQVQQHSARTPNGTNPMPQYFPSSPQPNQNGFVVASPPPNMGHSASQNQEILGNETQGQGQGQFNTPYPVKFGESLNLDQESKLGNKVAKETELADNVSKITVTDEK